MKNKKAILSSILSLAVCSSLVVGSTYALFTSEAKTNIAVTSGTVKVTATLSDLATYSMDNLMEKGAFENGGSASFSENDTALTLDKMTPGDKATFNVVVTNESNVAVQYCTLFTVETDDGLFEGLDVTINETLVAGSQAGEWKTFAVGAEPIVVPVEVELPEDAGDQYQGKNTKLSFAVNAVQGNVVAPTLVANRAQLQETIAEAEAGDVISILGEMNLGGETLNIPDGVTLQGGTLADTTIKVSDGNSAAFDGVTFEEATTVHAPNDSILEFKDCTFNISPEKLAGNGRAAAIIGGHQADVMELVVDNCVFNYQSDSADLWNAAIFMWSSVKNVSITNSEFNGYGFVAVKLMNVDEDANILFEGNTFRMSTKTDANYWYNTAIQICPQHDRTMTVTMKDNAFNGGYETVGDVDETDNDTTVVAEITGMNYGFALTKLTLNLEGNTLNGEALTVENIYVQK